MPLTSRYPSSYPSRALASSPHLPQMRLPLSAHSTHAAVPPLSPPSHLVALTLSLNFFIYSVKGPQAGDRAGQLIRIMSLFMQSGAWPHSCQLTPELTRHLLSSWSG